MREAGSTEQPPRDDAAARLRMVEYQLEARGIRDPLTLDAMRRVPREEFVPSDLRRRAYEDGALGIGGGQTISQPFIVARMTEALDLREWKARNPNERPRVLDVGTGSGYQAAILATMGASVTSLEVDAGLSAHASRTLARLGYDVQCVVSDGSVGYLPPAPYAAITVAAAAPRVPAPLTDQLADDGRLVLPIGPRDHQVLTLVWRDGDALRFRDLEPCVFVPLRGEYGYH